MRRLKWILPIVLAIYIFGFFLFIPLQLVGISIGWFWLSNIAYVIDDIAYRTWVNELDRENYVFKLRASNTTFWCGKFEHCNIE